MGFWRLERRYEMADLRMYAPPVSHLVLYTTIIEVKFRIDPFISDCNLPVISQTTARTLYPGRLLTEMTC